MKEKIGRIGKEHSLNAAWEEVCYFGFFILLSVAKGLGFYEGQKLFALLVAPALVLGFAKLAISSYTRRQAVAVLAILVITAIV